MSATAKLGADAGLCGHCRHAKINVTARGTAYLRCLRAAWDERLRRYPQLPVHACPGFDPDDNGAAGERDPLPTAPRVDQ